jgi:hypothetical protein
MHGGRRCENEHCSSSISTISTKSSRNYGESSRAANCLAVGQGGRSGAFTGGASRRALPGLRGAAVRAGDRRRDGRTKAEAALAHVGGLVDRPACGAYALDCSVAHAQAHRGDGHRRRRLAPVLVSAVASTFTQGVGEACSHRSMRKDPCHWQRFRPARAISWAIALAVSAVAWASLVARRAYRFGILSGDEPLA